MEGVKMKRLLVACFLLTGCAIHERFVKLDEEAGFQANAKADPPQVFVDEGEMAKNRAPPFRYIGVVEIEGMETEKLSVFYERVAKAGAGVGCEAMLQRDAFQGVVGIQGGYTRALGAQLHRNNLAVWQFLCGIRGASEAESAVTMKKAVALAVRMRADAFGYEPCAAYTPTGSHVHKTRVCADDPNGRSRPDGASLR
jgi:hypothetical protein